MDNQLIITFVILVVAMILFLSERIPSDLVALLVVAGLGLTGVLTAPEAFSGFSRSAVVTIVAVLVLAHGLERTGVSERVGNLLLRVAGVAEHRLVATVTVAGAFLSLFMNNIAAASILLPAVSGAARKSQVNKARLLMPLAFGTLLGGMATLLTTTNIVVSGLLRQAGLEGFGLLDFAPVGMPLVVVGVVYMAFWGRRLLPARRSVEQAAARGEAGDIAEVYELSEYLFRVRVIPGSGLVGRPLGATGFREQYGVTVVAIERRGELLLAPSPETGFQEGDVLLLAGELEEFFFRSTEKDLEVLQSPAEANRAPVSAAVVIAEAMLSPRSRLIDQTLCTSHFREKFGATVLAVWRAGRQIYAGLRDLPLEFGDALLLYAPRARLQQMHDDPDLILLAEKEQVPTGMTGKSWRALAIMVGTLALAAVGPFPVGEVVLGGALVMILSGVLTMEQAYQSVEWRLVFLVAGMLPLGIAMTKTGAAALLAKWLVALVGPAGPLAVLTGLMVLTVVLSQAMKGAAVATVMTPIAIQAAARIGGNPRALAMGVALATSMAFVTPLGHPVNILVMGEGGYRFRDYAKVGLPLTLILVAVILLVLPMVWPLMQR